MANSENQAPVTIQELLVSSLAQTDALAKLLIEKGIITAGVHAEDCRRAGDVSDDVKADITLTYNNRNPSCTAL